ncbi:hypothetical protein ABDK09_09560 [Vibrio sp. CDRSL-10 TSBA]
MNKKILNAALVLVPRNLQNKAVSKALNFLFPVGTLAFDEKKVFKLELKDLNRYWIVRFDDFGFRPCSVKSRADIEIYTNFDVLFLAQNTNDLCAALDAGLIQFKADERDRYLVESSLKSLSQNKIDELVQRCYSFFKIKPKPRFDLDSVKLTDIKTSKDVDWLRDEAVKLEKINLPEALRLMELAHLARPSGPFIRQKVEEYRASLKLD